MKTIATMISGVAATLMFANSASATSYNLASLISSGDSITFGDKIFDDFNFSSLGYNASSILVEPSIDSAGVYYLSFSGWLVTSSGGFGNATIQYSVATTSGQPLITMIDQAFVPHMAGTGGFVSIAERVSVGGFSGPTIANSNVGYAVDPNDPTNLWLDDTSDPPGEVIGDNLVFPKAEKQVWVVKDVAFQANPGGIAGTSFIIQSFHQVPVPDAGTTLFLLGVAISSLTMIGKRPFE